MKVIKKAIIIAMAAIMSLSTMVIATGCGDDGGKTIEVDGWRLFKFGITWKQRGQINIIDICDESLVVDGVLNIPAKIGKYKITGFGRPMSTLWRTLDEFDIPKEFNVERVILAAELEINNFFSGVKYVEFLSTTFEKVNTVPLFEDRVYIIPDGTTQNFLDRIDELYTATWKCNFIEKSEFLKEKQLEENNNG